MAKVTIVLQDKQDGGVHMDMIAEPPLDGALTPAQGLGVATCKDLLPKPVEPAEPEETH